MRYFKGRLIFILFAHVLISASVVGQTGIGGNDIKDLFESTNPRNKQNFDKPGNYEMSVLINKKNLNKGDKFNIDIFFTGYGEIGTSKIYVAFSDSILDPVSTFSTSLDYKDGILSWGYGTYEVRQLFIIALSGGLTYKNRDSSKYVTQYIDAEKEPQGLGIITEYKIGKAPVALQLKLMDDVKAGDYFVSFYYTYFNGIEWKTSKVEVPIKVNSFVEEHSGMFTIIGLILAIITVIPIFYSVYIFYKKRLTKKVKKNKKRGRK